MPTALGGIEADAELRERTYKNVLCGMNEFPSTAFLGCEG